MGLVHCCEGERPDLAITHDGCEVPDNNLPVRSAYRLILTDAPIEIHQQIHRLKIMFITTQIGFIIFIL